jgi:hypothetical protein
MRERFFKGDIVELTSDAISSIEGSFMKKFFGKKLHVLKEKTDSAGNIEGYILGDEDKKRIDKDGKPFIFISADIEKQKRRNK